MKLNPCLSFDGRCEAAFKFYLQCLGGHMQTKMTWGESPMADQVPAEWRDRIVHSTMVVGETELMGSDAPPDRYEQPKGFFVTIQVEDPTEAETVFNKLAEKGAIQMPMQKTFWSPGFGMLVDQFGIPWMINSGPAAQESNN
jgi:PhnB protein